MPEINLRSMKIAIDKSYRIQLFKPIVDHFLQNIKILLGRNEKKNVLFWLYKTAFWSRNGLSRDFKSPHNPPQVLTRSVVVTNYTLRVVLIY